MVVVPNHDSEHLQRMTAESAAARRTAQLAGLIATAPPLSSEQLAMLKGLLAAAEETAR